MKYKYNKGAGVIILDFDDYMEESLKHPKLDTGVSVLHPSSVTLLVYWIFVDFFSIFFFTFFFLFKVTKATTGHKDFLCPFVRSFVRQACTTTPPSPKRSPSDLYYPPWILKQAGLEQCGTNIRIFQYI